MSNEPEKIPLIVYDYEKTEYVSKITEYCIFNVLEEIKFTEECKKYVKEIITILENTKGVVFDKEYDIESINNDRDKDIFVSYKDFKIIVRCKYRNLKNIGYNEIGDFDSLITTYHKDHISFMVTNKKYSKNARTEAKNMNIILCQTSNLIKNIKKEIKLRKKMVDEKKKVSNEVMVEIQINKKIKLEFSHLPIEIVEEIIKYYTLETYDELLENHNQNKINSKYKENFDILRLVNKDFKYIFEKYFISLFSLQFHKEIIIDNYKLLLKFIELHIDTHDFTKVFNFFYEKQVKSLTFWEILILNGCLIDSEYYNITEFFIHIKCFHYFNINSPNKMYVKNVWCGCDRILTKKFDVYSGFLESQIQYENPDQLIDFYYETWCENSCFDNY
ncbi:13560_t:CDS:2 [Cetraspora pellucida]|uniref:13560_t:CDS:1 n=1 Tax=Cetraspora pellucida TaxID=1433469 RepID=A0A9N9BFS4_9GLOM|nr:13560_t:CDS:2 [Cetraspora pellucida]